MKRLNNRLKLLLTPKNKSATKLYDQNDLISLSLNAQKPSSLFPTEHFSEIIEAMHCAKGIWFFPCTALATTDPLGIDGVAKRLTEAHASLTIASVKRLVKVHNCSLDNNNNAVSYFHQKHFSYEKRSGFGVFKLYFCSPEYASEHVRDILVRLLAGSVA